MEIFKNKTYNQEFLERGFVKFPLLSKEKIEALKQFYKSEVSLLQKDIGGKGFHTTSNTNNQELILKVDAFLKENLLETLNQHLVDCNYTIANYLVKEPGANSEVPPHQDWMLVDEPNYRSFNIWVSLDDANYKSGNLKFIPGSHLVSNNTRTLNHPRYFDHFSKNLEGYFENVLAQAGDCVVFDHAIIHSSRKNRTKHSRISCVVGAHVKGSQLYFIYPSENDTKKAKKYTIKAETLLHMGENYLPQIEISKEEKIDLVQEHVSFSKFKAIINKQVSLPKYLKNKLINLWFN